MFKCAGCKVVQPAGTKPNRVVIEKRPMTYSNWGGTSRGWEVVKEVNLCDSCHVVGETQ